MTLIEHAIKAREKSYCKYSGFAVGAALLCDDGSIYTGCNIENSSYSPTLCAERVAFSKAISDGKTKFVKIAVVGGPRDDEPDYCTPCGVCRQFMTEFCGKDFIIQLKKGDSVREYTLSEMIPHSFCIDGDYHEV